MLVRNLQILSICLISTLLIGCGSTSKKPEIIIETVERVPIVLPTIDQLSLDPVEWVIITNDNAKEVLDMVEQRGNDPVIFGLTDKGYENASINQAKTLKLIIQQLSVINALTKYYIKEKINDTDQWSE